MWHMIRFVTISKYDVCCCIAWSPLPMVGLEPVTTQLSRHHITLVRSLQFDDEFWDSIIQSHAKITRLPLGLKTRTEDPICFIFSNSYLLLFFYFQSFFNILWRILTLKTWYHVRTHLSIKIPMLNQFLNYKMIWIFYVN